MKKSRIRLDNGRAVEIADYISISFAVFLGTEDGISEDDAYDYAYNDMWWNNNVMKRLVHSEKAEQWYKPITPKDIRPDPINNYRDLFADRHGFEVWMEESYGYSIGTNFQSSYHRLASGARITTKTYFLWEGHVEGKLFVDGKPAVSIFRANFQPNIVENLARHLGRITGAFVQVVDRPRIVYKTR